MRKTLALGKSYFFFCQLKLGSGKPVTGVRARDELTVRGQLSGFQVAGEEGTGIVREKVDSVGECTTKHLTSSITNHQSKDFSLL